MAKEIVKTDRPIGVGNIEIDVSKGDLDTTKLQKDLASLVDSEIINPVEETAEEKASREKLEANKGKSEEELEAEKAAEKKAQEKKDEVEEKDLKKYGKQKKKEKEGDVVVDDKIQGLLDDKAPDGLSDEGAKDWGTLKDKANTTITDLDTKVKAHEKTITDLRKRLDDGGDSEATETLKSQNKELSEKLYKVDVKNSAQFMDKFTGPKDKMFSALEQLFKDHDIKTDANRLLSLNGKALSLAVEEVIKELPSMDKQDVVDTVKGYRALAIEENEVLTNAKIATDEMRKQMDVFTEEVFSAEFRSIADEEGRMVDHRETPEGASAETVAQDIAYNKSVDSMEEVARQIATGNMDQKMIAHVASVYAWAGHLFNEGLPQVQGDFNAMLSQMKAWKVEIEKIREANPNMSIDSIETLEKKVDADYSHEGEHDPAALNRLVQKEIIDKR